MAKTILNNEVTNAELNFMLARLRNSMVYDNKKTASVYLAGIHKQTFESLAKMGIKFDKLHHGIKMYAPNKGTKAYKTLFEGVDLKGMLAKAKEIATAAAKATAKAKAEKKTATAAKAAKVAKKTTAPKAKKTAAKVEPTAKVVAAATPKVKKAEKAEKKPTAKATPKAKAEKKPTAKVETPKTEKVEVAAESK